jgi:hypothetical protein
MRLFVFALCAALAASGAGKSAPAPKPRPKPQPLKVTIEVEFEDVEVVVVRVGEATERFRVDVWGWEEHLRSFLAEARRRVPGQTEVGIPVEETSFATYRGVARACRASGWRFRREH